MNSNKNTLTIGKVATAAGVNVETIRYYQKKGLIVEPNKPYGGFRHYPADTVDRLCFIKRAQKLGFSLDEIIQLLSLGETHCSDIQSIARNKSTLIQSQIDGLRTIQSALDQLVTSCQIENNSESCAFFDALSKTNFLE